MSRTLALLLAASALLGVLLLAAARQESRPATVTETRRSAVLIRFGIDGARDADWSGSLSPAPARVAAWQFDARDALNGGAWKCATREERYWDTPYERSMRGTSNRDKVTRKGLVVEFDAAVPRQVRVATAQGSFSFGLEPSLWAAPRRFLNDRVEVRAAPAITRLASAGEVEDFPALLEANDGTLWMAYQGFTAAGDHIFVRRRLGGAWSEPQAVTPSRGDYFRTALAQDRAGKIWVVWAAQVNGNFDLYASGFDGKRWSPPERLTTAANSDIYHALASDRAGNLHLAYQSARSGNFDIYLRVYDGQRWSNEMQVSSDPANDWQPALAAAPDGRVTIVWDTYAKGSYDVVCRTYSQGKLGPLVPLAASGAFESRASAQYDAEGRLWVAFDEGDWNWGKDYGNLVEESGRGLLVRRQARVAVLANGRLLEPSPGLAGAVPEDMRQVFQQPKLILDRRGIPWVFFRYRVNLPQLKGGGTYRGLWRMGVTSCQQGRWLPMIEFPEGFGRMDAPVAAVAGRRGDLEVAWVTDGREFPNGFPRQQDLCLAAIPPAPAAAPVQLVAFAPSVENLPHPHPNEAADVARVRAYRSKAAGRDLRIARGDIHRHTDLSWDGNRDGSLDDAYRYALDAAGFDFLGVCDHQAGQSIPYHWWMIQKAADLFTIQGRFAPLYSYERSLSWPNGHRNVVFARRGNPVLDPSAAEQRGEEGAGKLYQYVRELNGLVSSHTSATGAGTDWRDSDPELEPVVEIYQGYRNNYEGPDVPRRTTSKEAERFAAGFVWNAWAKGIRLGVQSSSDHVSTHMSYAGVFTERIDREAIFQALKARRSFAATDNVIVDFRAAENFMGEAATTRGPVSLKAYIRGTGPLAAVTLIKNNRVIYAAPGAGSEMNFSYTDAAAGPAEAWYYLRIEQRDGQLGWSSPIWVKH